MSDYNDGSQYGHDVINPYDDFPLMFEPVQMQGRNVLLSRNEIPRMPAKHDDQLDKVSLKTVTRKIENFTSGLGWSMDDQQLILIFLVLIVVVMQIKMMMQMDMQYTYMNHIFPVMHALHR